MCAQEDPAHARSHKPGVDSLFFLSDKNKQKSTLFLHSFVLCMTPREVHVHTTHRAKGLAHTSHLA